MAVLNSCPGLEVHVISNQRKLSEYADSQATNPPNTTTNYVEVESDGAFQVHLQFANDYTCRYGVSVEVRLDGHKVAGCLYAKSRLKQDAGHTVAGARSKIRGRWHVSSFRFSRFVLDLHSSTKPDQTIFERLKSTGVITVLVHRVKNLRNEKRSTHSKSDRPHGVTKFGRVSEKAVKELGLSHHGSVDRPKQEKAGVRSRCCSNVDGTEDEHAIAIFNFKYRSLAILQSLGVAPAPPPPVVLPSRPRTPTAEPSSTPQQVNATAHMTANQHGLSTLELLVLMRAYRGSVDGLEGLSREDLMILLEHHRASQGSNTQDTF